ncbi:arf-GAP with Rho-GAP domain, ANK repeat and PH domain-containing protein 1-like isoform X1 [Micropterus dolomieu]|uniref:arf-GAP with Rho-GAP domain, ANK repeat and PH domain-containing protein 1-like isoform X1 n=2 Tax=Micropterus dolomieu TaxID=147949 RepID=UPI001E8DF391|nr:arf-GAP with Rho-GAP domain, ANK repeat and PH domain-containing protein 1-like isoform X1 [Micropterus dolomieu]XP_045929276.1 arf-GAP with Rho-GAP domain, ANK repeat and PH domain-containing protein 1-like isoform X1 [Micropterus dolomieu]XP_045929277.1 arf-GAP with Rho-GAP domain, ANK repeat and PH domain-containing protein 1-like isoform X1 [Micropterus dolomieu]
MSQSESCATVWDWLCVLRLEQYYDAFQSAGLATSRQCRSLTPDQLEQMGITLPGHRRRILASLNKTHGNSDTQCDTQCDAYSRLVQSERDQRLEETRHAKVLQRERPMPTPGEGKLVLEEREKRAGETLRPIPREREKPVPRVRQVSRMKEKSEEERQTKPVPGQRQTAPRGGKGEERDGGIDGQMERPVPKERTKFRSSAQVDCNPSPFVAPASDTSLPPVPPRSTPNCPPQCFTSSLNISPPAQTPSSPQLDTHTVKAPAVQSRSVSQSCTPTSAPTHTPLHPPNFPTRPQTLAIQPRAQHLGSDGGRKTSPVSPIASPSDGRNAPPLPPKVGTGCKGPPPIPQRILAQSPRTHSPSPTLMVADEMQENQTPQVLPRIRTPSQTFDNTQQSAQPDTQPVLPAKSVSQPTHESRLGLLDDNIDDYEDPDLFHLSLHRMNTPDMDVSLHVPCQTKGRYNSLCSDDGLLEEDDTLWQDGGLSNLQGSVYLPNTGRLATATKEDSSQLTAVIKMGWLDKNPPQGALYYQRRWVKLDVDYLRYFDNDKEVYSKGIISTAFITNVTSVGELKFEVVTNNRTFIFRAESEVERNDWVTVLLDCTRGRSHPNVMSLGSPLTPDHQGYLELRGLRSKLYTVVASDKVFLYKSIEDYRIGVGITSIEMNVGNVKDTDRRSFDLTTPYRIFSFIAESEQLREQWVDAMRVAIGEALSNSEVAERIWAEPSNSLCADCGAPKPEWAAINLCVVVCKRCAGEHRGLGPSVSKVRSLKMDKKVWTEELVQVFLLLGNERVNSFWAANIPPSEALTPSSCSEDRRRFIANKYRQGKYRKYHPLYGNQRELNNALCINVQCSDVLETLSLIFCGADVNCSTGMASLPTPLSLANAHSQPLQAELLSHNLNTELPRSEVGEAMDAIHYSAPPCVSHNGFLFKTASMARAITERKGKEEFSRRWCTLNDGTFSYYESDKNSNPNGSLKASEIACLAVDPTEKHGYEHSFELYSESERLYLFGTDQPDSHKEWVKSIAKSFIPATAEPLLRLGFERIGRLKYKDGLNLQTSKVGWFALVGSKLHAYLADSQGEEIHLRKLNELSIQQDNEVLVLVEKGRTLYIEGERKLDFAGWCGAIQAAAGSGGDTLSQQQLTETDIPVIVDSCIGYITQCGMTSEGIYRKSGVNSRVAALCERFRRDARSLCLREGEHQVDDVSNTLKRFFRELEEGLFTSEDASTWLSTAAIQDESMKISQYQLLLNRLPRVNKATLQALINHLYLVQRFSEQNQMNLHNLAIVFGPTLFQTDGKDYTAGRAIEDLIQHYTLIFEVDEQQLKKQLDMIEAINQMRDKLSTKFPSTEPGGHFICTVYLEEKKDTAEQHVKIPGAMTAAELTCEVLDLRNISVKRKEYWSCWEVSDKEEMERPLHYQERVLPILHSFGTDSHLLIKKHLAMDAMIIYLANKVDASKQGMMKFREERSILGLSTGSFHDRYFILNSNSLRMYKEVRSNRPERDWPVKSLTVYLGIKKKLRPPTCWGLTVVYVSKKQEKPDRQQWYICCDTQSEMREWYATFLTIQSDGNVWPEDGLQQTRVSRVIPDTRHGNVSLIPLRGSENEMRNSVAAFSQDPLALFRDVR